MNLTDLPYPQLLQLSKKGANPQAEGEIYRRKKEGVRPKVRGFKKHSKLSDFQQRILRLLLSGVTGETTVQNVAKVEVNFAKHTARGGWVSWLTATDEDDLGDLIKKISRVRVMVEEEKTNSGLCRIYLIPVRNEKDGWEGFKVRLDRGTRLVYEEH
jgi:hypothetical protein